MPTLRALGIALGAWDTLGCGSLAGATAEPGKNNFRRNNPRFRGDNLRKNRDRFAPVMQIANERSITPAHLALAWLLRLEQDIFPIPATRRAERIEENAQAAGIHLAPELLSASMNSRRPRLLKVVH